MSNIKINRKGKNEAFDEKKIYASCYHACMSANKEKESAEEICEKVTERITGYVLDVSDNEMISSDQIFRKTTECMHEIDRESALIYESTRDNI